MQVIGNICSHLRFSHRSWGELLVTVFFFSWLWCGHLVLELHWKPIEIMLVLIFSVFTLPFFLRYLFREFSQVIIFNPLMSWILAANHLQEKLNINCVSVWVQYIIAANFIAKPCPTLFDTTQGKIGKQNFKKKLNLNNFFVINSFTW